MKKLLEKITNPKILAIISIGLLALSFLCLFQETDPEGVGIVKLNPFYRYIAYPHIIISIIYFAVVLKWHKPIKELTLLVSLSQAALAIFFANNLKDNALQIKYLIDDGIALSELSLLDQTLIVAVVAFSLSLIICYLLMTVLFVQSFVRTNLTPQRKMFIFFLLSFAVLTVASVISSIVFPLLYGYPTGVPSSLAYLYMLPMTSYIVIYINYKQRKEQKNDKN